MTDATFARNCIVFGRVLRRFGLGAAPDRVVLFARALDAVGLGSRQAVKQAGRCVFVRNPNERRRYDRAFDAFWSALAPASEADERAVVDQPEQERAGAPNGQIPSGGDVSADRPASGVQELAGGVLPARLMQHGDRSFTYSFTEALGERDFSKLTEAELAMARELADQKRLQFGMYESRRTSPGHGGAFDARRTLRASLRQYGELVRLQTRTPTLRRRDVVLLCDVSGSMDRYSRLLLQFIHAMRHALGNVEAFVFGTRLTRITRQVRRRDVNEALNAVSASVVDWGGGTRIGECLHEFNTRWARRVLARGAIVIVISDGWDRGDTALLAREMQRLQRSSYRLVWLNPLLGGPRYRPQTIGMRAALPFIDDFLPAHNLRSLVQLVLALGRVERRRPVRSQSRTTERAG